MQPAITSNTDILHALYQLPSSKRDEVLDFIQFLNRRSSKKQQTERKSLKGIWEDKGFENITNLEEVVKDAKSELQESILKREF